MGVHGDGIVVFDGVSVAGQDAPILDDVTFGVASREIYGLVTEDRALPSTVAALATGALRPSEGAVNLRHANPADDDLAARALVLSVPAQAGLPQHLSVVDGVRLYLRLAGIVVTRTSIEASLRECEVPDRRFDRGPAELRALERLGVWLALAHLRNVPALVLTSPGDDLKTHEIRHGSRMIREAADRGPATILAGSRAEFIRRTADRSARLDAGRLVSESRGPAGAGEGAGLS